MACLQKNPQSIWLSGVKLHLEDQSIKICILIYRKDTFPLLWKTESTFFAPFHFYAMLKSNHFEKCSHWVFLLALTVSVFQALKTRILGILFISKIKLHNLENCPSLPQCGIILNVFLSHPFFLSNIFSKSPIGSLLTPSQKSVLHSFTHTLTGKLMII